MFSSTFHPQSPHSYSTEPYQVYNIDDDEFPENEGSPTYTPPSSNDSFSHHHHNNRHGRLDEKSDEGMPFYSHQALTAHNRRMIIPYKKQVAPRNPGSRNNNRVITSSSPSTGLSFMHDEPLVMYRFFEFYCATCDQSWLSPLYRAKDGLFCRICHQFCQPRGIRHSFTPYLGKETCYGKYLCHNCNRGFSSYKSLSNCPDQCFQCGTLVYPYYQIAHSVLYQKIRKNDTNFRPEDSPHHHHHHNFSTQSNLQNNQNNNRSRHTRHQVRKIASGIITSSSSAKQHQPSNKKRLHCLNNVQQQHNILASSQLGRRQVYLKACYSEPTIGNGTTN